MSELLNDLRELFKDEDARYAYSEGHLNAAVSAQIRKFRGDLSQQGLAEKIGTKQSGISRLERANYDAWKIETLRKLARAFGLRLKVSFEEFGTLLPEITDFNSNVLGKRSFEKDPLFSPSLELKKTPQQSDDFRAAAKILIEASNGFDSGATPNIASPEKSQRDESLEPPISIGDAKAKLDRRIHTSSRRGRIRHAR